MPGRIKIDPQQIGVWRDMRTGRQNFERKRGRPDREPSPTSVHPAISEDMGWAHRAAIIREMRASVHATWQSRNKSDAAGDAWRAAADEYRAALEYAFRPDFLAAVTALQERQTTDLEPILAFLEADPYFYRSGYMTENILRWLKRCLFSSDDVQRICALILRSVRRRGWSPRIFAYYARLAPKVNLETLRAELQEAASGADTLVTERAHHVLRLLNRAPPISIRLLE